MSIGSTAVRRASRRWRPSILELILLLLVIAAAGWGVRSLGKVVESHIITKREDAINSLFGLLNRNISYGDISPSLLRAFEIRDLTIHSADATEEPLVSIRRLRLRYSLARLIASRDPISALREVQLVNSDFTVNLERDHELGQVLQNLGFGSGGITIPGAIDAARLPVNLAGANLSAVFEGMGYRFELRDLFFRVRTGEQLRVSANGKLRTWLPDQLSDSLAAGAYFDTELRVTGSAASDFGHVDLTVHLVDLASPVFAVDTHSLQVTLSENVLQVVRIKDKTPLNLALLHNLTTGRSELTVAATELHLDDAVEFRAPGVALGLLQGSTLSGTARWWQDPATGMGYVAELNGHLAAEPGSAPPAVAVSARGDDTRVVVSKLTVTTEDGGLEFAGDVLLDPVAPQGEVAIRSLRVRPGDELDARLSVTRHNGGLALRGSEVTLGSTVFRRFDVDLQPATAAPRTYRYQIDAELQQDSANRINAEGVLNLAGGRYLQMVARFTDVGASGLYRLATGADRRQPWLTDTLQPLFLSGTVDAATDFKSLTIRPSSLQVRDGTDPDNRLQFSLTANAAHVLVEQVSGDWLGLQVSGRSEIREAAAGLALNINGVPYELQLNPTSDSGFRATGSHDFTLDAAYDASIKGVVFSGSATRLPFPLPGLAVPLQGSLAFNGHFAGVQDWSLRSDALSVSELHLLGLTDAQVEVGFQAHPGGVELERVAIADPFSALLGSGSIAFAPQSDGFSAQLVMDDGEQREHYEIALEMASGTMQASAELRGVGLERFGEFPISGDLRAAVQAAGPPQELRWTAAVELDHGRFNAEAVSLAADVELAGNRVAIHDLSFDLLSHHLRNGTGEYDWESGHAQLSTDYTADYFGKSVAAHLRLTTDQLVMTDGASLQDALAGGVQAVLHVDRPQVTGEPLDSWQLRLVAEPANGVSNAGGVGGMGGGEEVADAGSPVGAAGPGVGGGRTGLEGGSPSASGVGEEAGSGGLLVRFEGGPHEAFTGYLSTTGGFSVGVHGHYPLRGAATGTLIGGLINAEVELEEADARILNEILGAAPLMFQAGSARGRIQLTGPVNDPDFWGGIQLTGGAMVSPLSPQVVGPFSAALEVHEKHVAITGFAPEVGAALPIVVSGTASMERWVPASFALDLATTGVGGIPIQHQFGPLLFDGYATGAVSVAGAAGTIRVSGALQADRADISIADLDPAGGMAKPLLVDVVITTGRSVEFTWPSTQFPILRLMLVPSEQVRIGYDGSAGSFSVQGDVDVRGGDLFYFNRQFLMREGRISFAEDESRFDPRLVMRAEARERDAYGDPVRIVLEADTTLNRFSPETVRLSSDPPQSAMALDALLRDPLGGGGGADNDGSAGMSAAAFSGDLLAQVALLRPVERALREALGVDMVSIRSPFVQNLVLEGLNSPNAAGLSPGAGNPLDNTSLSFGKYLGSDLFLTMLLRLETSGDAAAGLLPDIELSLDWATPFFLLEWSFLPLNAMTQPFASQTISLRWGWSY